MRNILLFLVYAMYILATLAGFSCVAWLPLFFIPTKAGLLIGAFITAATIAITKLLVDIENE